MKRKTKQMFALLLLTLGLVVAAGCQSNKGGDCVDCEGFGSTKWHTLGENKAPAPAPVVEAKAEPAPPPPPPAPGLIRNAMAFPSAVSGVSGNSKDCCAKVILEKTAPGQVALGQSFDYTLKATNAGNLEVRDVIVTDVLPANYKMASSNPAGTGAAGGKTTWDLGALKPGESKTITITGAASAQGEITNCATVSFVPYICVTTAVVQPALKLTKTAPAEVQLCDPIPTTLTVTNNGTGPATNVVIKDPLPAGLVTADGKNTLDTNIGTLAAGQSRSVTATLRAQKRGSYTNSAVATADGGLKSEASTTTKVTEPVLTITKTGTKKIFVGRNAEYTITVSNTGDGVANNTVVTDELPANGKFVSASDGGAVAGNVITWNLGSLAAGASKTLSVRVEGLAIGNILNKASVKATCAPAVNAQAETEIAGIPAILLEVIDINDPVELGKEEVYIITATNQGSLNGTDVTITCELEDSQEYVSSEGATKATETGKVIKFAPLPQLAPKAKATWKVTIKAVKEGDIRFKVIMTETQLGRPVQENEATNQYK